MHDGGVVDGGGVGGMGTDEMVDGVYIFYRKKKECIHGKVKEGRV